MKNLVYVSATHYVYIVEHENGQRNVQNTGVLATSNDFAMLQRLRIQHTDKPEWEFIDRMPTADEYGTTDVLSYSYRKATGQSLGKFYEFRDHNRIVILDRDHLNGVLEFAIANDATDALYKGLSYLACREDQTVIMSSDGPQSFFWYLVPREADRQYTMSARGRYHGGLIFHKDHSGKTPGEWSVHT
jgi:hypothetical protein